MLRHYVVSCDVMLGVHGRYVRNVTKCWTCFYSNFPGEKINRLGLALAISALMKLIFLLDFCWSETCCLLWELQFPRCVCETCKCRATDRNAAVPLTSRPVRRLLLRTALTHGSLNAQLRFRFLLRLSRRFFPWGQIKPLRLLAAVNTRLSPSTQNWQYFEQIRLYRDWWRAKWREGSDRSPLN